MACAHTDDDTMDATVAAVLLQEVGVAAALDLADVVEVACRGKWAAVDPEPASLW